MTGINSRDIAAFVAQQQAQGRKPNRLLGEKSPYLLQHAFNPVDWYPWGEEAFRRAREENRPIFLSIGYSTCHWCHVMAHESFEDPQVAALVNENFVPVKVDREERPDVDRIYMLATQALTGQGGWPMTVFLTPDLKPFFAGTYFPPQSMHGRPAFADLLKAIDRAWRTKAGEVTGSAAKISESLKAHTIADYGGELPGIAALEQAAAAFASEYDEHHGGFGGAPKFPRPSVPCFLLREHARSGNARAREMALGTLRAMADGGIRDHLGGGFHRYSVDVQWRVSHFEKMLYDQAQLVMAYLDAFQVTGDEAFAQVTRETLDYVRRDLTGPHGGFYSAEDADSPLPEDPAQHAEGAFYLWTAAEVDRVLDEDAEVFRYVHGVQAPGNVLADPHGEFGNRNVLYQAHTAEQASARFGLSGGDVEACLRRARAALMEVREKRPRPHRDDKVITAWNGLMISAFARAAQALEAQEYLDAARAAAQFILTHLFDDTSGTLHRRFRDGEAGMPGQLDDYAFLVQGLLDLYETDFDIRWLQMALRLTETQIACFADDARGGFFDTAERESGLILRMKEGTDSAEPSGNSVAALNLLRLSRMLDDTALRGRAHRTLTAFARVLEKTTASPQMLVALDFALAAPQQIVIAGTRGAPDTQALVREVHRRLLPHRVLLLADGAEGQGWLAERLPVIRDMRPQDGRATAYVCRQFVCEAPVSDPARLAEELSQINGLRGGQG
jgi:uncharacterized protein